MFSLAATIVAEEAKEKFVELLLVEERSHTTSRQCFLYQLELILNVSSATLTFGKASSVPGLRYEQHNQNIGTVTLEFISPV